MNSARKKEKRPRILQIFSTLKCGSSRCVESVVDLLLLAVFMMRLKQQFCVCKYIKTNNVYNDISFELVDAWRKTCWLILSVYIRLILFNLMFRITCGCWCGCGSTFAILPFVSSDPFCNDKLHNGKLPWSFDSLWMSITQHRSMLC